MLRGEAEEGGLLHSNPEATLSTFGFPAVFNPSFEALFFAFLRPLLIIEMCCAVSDSGKRNK